MWKAGSAENNSPNNAERINKFIKYFVEINKNEVDKKTKETFSR